MTDIEIETLLRKAPRSAVPAELLQNLIAEISVPEVERSRRNHVEPGMFFRRWFPAISFAVFLLTCVVVVGVQTNWIAQLKRENKTLRAASQNLDVLRQVNAEYKQLLGANQQLEQLQKDVLEVPKLRAEIEQLSSQVQELENLRAQNRQLLAARADAQKATEEEDPFAAAKKKAETVACISNLKQICLAALVWSQDNDEVFPSDFNSLSNELQTVKILVCPGDAKKLARLNTEQKGVVDMFSALNSSTVSYDLVSPGLVLKKVKDPANTVFAHCPIHNSAGFADGHVEVLGKKSRIVTKDGVTKVERSNEPQE